MIKIREHLTPLLQSYHPRVFYQTSPDSAKFPYLVYNFLPSFTEEELEVLPLDIDLWDNKKDTKDIEEIASRLWKELNYYRHNDQDMQLQIHRETRMPELDESEAGIRRRKLTFHVRYFDRNL